MTEETLFDLVLQRNADARAAFLAEACGDDAILRRRVEQLLSAHEHPAGFLAQPALATGPDGDVPPAEDVGSRIGPYRLLERLGEGGMGVVFLAEQEEPVRRRVALKVIKPGMDSQHVSARFEAERQALALMEHPNIARVLDVGTSSAGRPFFVMELCRGVPITEYSDQHRLGTPQCLALFVTVCQAVQHAHLKGVIHRDLKPSNVLVVDEGNAESGPVVKVIDFGIAKALTGGLTEQTMLTGGTQLLGTPMYMSPEQAEMRGDADTRSDVYALGILLYELLTGATPFDRDRLRAASFDEVRRIIREEEPPRPSTRLSTLGQAATTLSAQRQTEPRRLTRLLRGELDWIVMKALEKDRNRRYESASALAADVQRYLQNKPVVARPPTAWYRLRKFAQRHRLALGSSGVTAGLLLLIAGGVAWMLWDRATLEAAHVEDLARRQQETEQAAQLALAQTDLWREQLTPLPRTTSHETAAVLHLWHQAGAALDRAELVLATGQASPETRQRVEAVRADTGRGRSADEQRHAGLLRRERLLRDLDEACLAEQQWVNNQYDYAGAAAKYARAFATYGWPVQRGQAVTLAARITAEDPELRTIVIDALDHWASCAVRARQQPFAAELRQLADAVDTDHWGQRVRSAVRAGDRAALKALSARAQQGGLSRAKVVLLAMHLYYHVDRDEAIAVLRHGRGQYPTDFRIHNYLAVFLARQPNLSALEREEAIGCYRVAIAVRPEVGATYLNLGMALADQQRLDDAITAYRAALAVNAGQAQAHHYLGLALAAKQNLTEAIAAYRRALAVDPTYAAVYPALGAALAARHELDAAIDAFQKAIAGKLRSGADYHNLGTALLSAKRVPEALTAFRQALTLDDRQASGYVDLGDALAAANQLDDAIAAYHQALARDAKCLPAHLGLGNARMHKDQLPEAIAAYRQALAIDPRSAVAHTNLGLALAAQRDWAGAVAAFRAAIAIDDKLAEAHYSMGGALLQIERLAEAVTAFRTTLTLEPKHARCAPCWIHLGDTLRRLGRLDEAIPAYQQGLERDPDNAHGYFSLGHAYFVTGRLAEGCKATRAALRRGTADHPDRRLAEANLKQGERLLALEERLRDVLAGKTKPADNPERLGMIEVCRLQRRPATASRLYGEAFAADAALADDLRSGTRFQAARCAAQAAAGHGTDVAQLTAKERAQLRQQELAWLRAEVAACRKQRQHGSPAERALAHARLEQCRDHKDFRDVRAGEAFSRLPAAEQTEWRQLWSTLADALQLTPDIN